MAKVYLTGAGPGDLDLLTVKALRVIKEADVIIYDRLANAEILKEVKNGCEFWYVGKEDGKHTIPQDEINEFIYEASLKYDVVVRLKGGDPFVFGRGGEEAEFLKENKVKYEIVPGITSGIGSATYAGIPLTHRKYSSSVVFVTGHEDPEKKNEVVKWKRLAKSVDTIVIMMGLSRIDIICKQLVAGGMDKRTPVAVIQNGTTPKQKMIKGTVTNIAKKVKENKILPPTNIIIGKVVDLSETIGWK